MRAVVDTNVLIYDTFEDSIYHEEAKNILNSLKEWIIPTIVLHEYVWALKSLKIDVKTVLEKVEEYVYHVKTKTVYETQDDVIYSLKTILHDRLSLLRYNDMVILSIAIRLRTPLATFDKKLRTQAEKTNVKVLPE